MLSIIVLSAALIQQGPPPPPPLGARHVFVQTSGGPGLDRDGDGSVSREEFTAPLAQAFDDMDKDGDGRLSMDEMAARRGPGLAGGHMVVTDHGGPAERRIRIERVGGPAEGAREANVMVLSGDGEAWVDGPPMPGMGEGGPRRFELRALDDEAGEIDADGDGRVSETEFTAPLARAFREMDADGSGYLEAGERAGDRQIRVITRRVERREGAED